MQRAEIIFLALRQLGFEGSFYDATDYLDELTEEARFNRFKSADFLEACSESVKEAYAEHKNIDRAYHADIIFNALEKAARE
jgi:hypothetical protein